MLVQIAPLADPRNTVRFFDRIIHRPAITIAAVLATVAVGARALVGLERSVRQALLALLYGELTSPVPWAVVIASLVRASRTEGSTA